MQRFIRVILGYDMRVTRYTLKVSPVLAGKVDIPKLSWQYRCDATLLQQVAKSPFHHLQLEPTLFTHTYQTYVHDLSAPVQAWPGHLTHPKHACCEVLPRSKPAAGQPEQRPRRHELKTMRKILPQNYRMRIPTRHRHVPVR